MTPRSWTDVISDSQHERGMSKARKVCPHCGALQRDDALTCDLCGSDLGGESSPQSDEPEAVEGHTENSVTSAPAGQKRAQEPVLRTGGYCTSCGAPYPEGARFCGSCGDKLIRVESRSSSNNPQPSDDSAESKSDSFERAAPPVAEPAKLPRAATDRELGRQVLIVVGAGLLLVVGLFAVTVVSQNSGSSDAPAPARSLSELAARPLDASVSARVDSLRIAIEQLSGNERVAKQGELVDFFLANGRLDLAGAEQEQVAVATGREVDWVRTGNLYYDWMESVDGNLRATFARKSIDAYQKALEINPDNLDVRTDMAIAYMNDPENSMQAIAQTNMVLEANPEHVQANFNRGIMLLRINRYDDAVAQFEKVKQIVGDAQNPIYQRAESALDAVRQLRGE